MATKERPQDTLCGIEFRYHSYKDPCTVVTAPLDEAVTCQYCIAISMGLNPETRTPETTEEQ